MIPLEWYTKTKNIHHLRVGREESSMSSPGSTSDSSWNQAGGPNAPATDETGMDPGSILPQEIRLRGIDIHPLESTENALARPAQIDPTYFALTMDLNHWVVTKIVCILLAVGSGPRQSSSLPSSLQTFAARLGGSGLVRLPRTTVLWCGVAEAISA